MKNKLICCLVSVIVCIVILCSQSYAILLPSLCVLNNNYSAGDKIIFDEIDTIEVGRKLQLYALIEYGNDLIVDDDIDSLGMFVKESNLSNVTWQSSDSSIATVDEDGKVTGISEGKVTITASYINNESKQEEATKEIQVITPPDIYDVILFWGQSNMVGFCGLSDTSSVTYGEKIKDKRYDYTNAESVATFSKKTGIDEEYIKNSEKMNYVRIKQVDNTIYEYKFLSNKLEEITEETKLYGEKLSYTSSRSFKGNYFK